MALIFYPSPLGTLTIREQDDCIVAIAFPGQPFPQDSEQNTPLLCDAARQLTEYFQGQRVRFDLPLSPKGTPFQKKVWEALCEIPYGETASYGDIARKIGCPKGFRAVGMANHHNPIPILIPCHRVIGSDGSLTGFGGGLPIKKALLELERTHRIQSERNTL